jgi:Flp pilus assembly pilin Flp
MEDRTLSSRPLVRTRCSGDDGASLVEYAVLLALISVVCIVAVGYLGNMTGGKLSSVNATFDPGSGVSATVPPTTVFNGDNG